MSVWSPFFAPAVLFIRPEHPNPTQPFAGQANAAGPAPGHQWMADREVSNVGDPELGAAAMEEDDATGGGDGAGGSGGGGGLEDCPDDNKE